MAPAAGPASGGGFAFGPYRLEPHPPRLMRDGVPVDLKPRQLEVLKVLVANAGEVLPIDALLTAVWGDTAVAPNSLERTVCDLRKLLDPDDRGAYIVNLRGRGYRFIAATTPDEEPPALDIRQLLAPDRAWGDGLAALESLARDELVRARAALEQLVAAHPREPRFRIGLALTCALLYDSTRAAPHPDVETLQRAEVEAREACRLNPDHAESSATLGFVLERTGDRENALAALRRATRLDRHNWLHHCRLAVASWGQERLGAVRDTLAHNPGFAIAHFLGATVWVAREALDDAEREVDAGIAAMAAETKTTPRYTAVALHYLKGLLRLARGETDDALASLDREIALEPRGHLYGRECCANAWYAKGTCYLKLGDLAAAREAFGEALARVPHHPMAQAGLTLVERRDPDLQVGQRSGAEAASSACLDGESSTLLFEHEMARAALLVDAGDVAAAARLIEDALTAASPGNTGWLIPIEPLLRVSEHPETWAPVLAILHARAR